MIFSDEFLSKAIARINELQNDTIREADKVKGSKEYVEKQMKLFEEAEKHRKMLNALIHQQDKNFFLNEELRKK